VGMNQYKAMVRPPCAAGAFDAGAPFACGFGTVGCAEPASAVLFSQAESLAGDIDEDIFGTGAVGLAAL